MANIVYADPFGSALEGKRQALHDVLTAAKTGRDLREQDQNYDFKKWHTPFLKQEVEHKANMEALKQASVLAHYTGDLRPYNEVVANMGYNPQNLPPGYESGQHVNADQQRAADFASGVVPAAMSYSNIQSADGQSKFHPNQQNANEYSNPEVQKARDDFLLNYFRNGGAQQPTANEIDKRYLPDFGFPSSTPTTTSPVSNYLSGPSPSPKNRTINSIWHDEYDPTKTIDENPLSNASTEKPYNSDQ